METKLYLSVDGGGTKLHTLLFDSELRPVGSGVSGAINPNFVPMDLVEQHMLDSIDQALGSAGWECSETEEEWIKSGWRGTKSTQQQKASYPPPGEQGS